MPMRVVCANCGKQFSAWDDLVGKQVQCPKCQHTMILGGANPILDKPPPSAPAVPKKANPLNQPSKSKNPTSGPAPTRKENPSAASPAARGPAPAPPAVPAKAPVRPTPLPRTFPAAKPSADFDGDDTMPLGCPKCNAPMEKGDDLCDACGYHLILKKVIDVSDMKKPNKTTGFERFLQDQLHETESSQSTMNLMKIFAAVAMVILMFFCLGRWWWVGVLVVGGGAALYWAQHRKRAAESPTDDSPINQDPLSGALWSMLLAGQRLLSWRLLQPPFSRVKSITLRDSSLTDEELSELEGLEETEALDIEGTAVTNDGLQHLRGLKKLRFVVLRRTQVTPSGVRRLQQDLPTVLIWH
jgi:DNA-directed RNA polymerase subunit RPC12/RpoP